MVKINGNVLKQGIKYLKIQNKDTEGCEKRHNSVKAAERAEKQI